MDKKAVVHIHNGIFSLVQLLSRVWLFATPWTVAYQASPSMGFSRQEYWSGLPFPSPGDPPNPGIKPGSPALQADALLSEPPGKSYSAIKKNTFESVLMRWIKLEPIIQSEVSQKDKGQCGILTHIYGM